jgi:hypothetical protein
VRAAETLITKLSGVKATGKGRWMACCPAHEDGSPSLSIREMDDGRVLIYDFGGCSALEVLGAVGLEMTDLFADRITHHAAPIKGGFTHEELLLSLEHESFVALLIIEAAQDAELTAQGLERLERSVQIIHKIRALAYRS